MIVPFWADIDTRKGGFVYYREATDASLLDKAKRDIDLAYPNLPNIRFNWIFVTTWSNVAFYGSSSSCDGLNKRNTFQLALVSDGLYSFAIFYYNTVTWTTGTASGGDSCGLGGTPAKAGFDYGDGRTFYTIEGSCSSQVTNLPQTTNVESPGIWVFKIDNELEEGMARFMLNLCKFAKYILL